MPTRNSIATIVATAAVLWAAVLKVQGVAIGWEFATPFAVVVSGLAGLIALFNHRLWRWPIVQSLTGRPDVSGTYVGQLQSDWVDPAANSEVVYKRVAFVVSQTYDSISCSLYSEQSRSSTVSCLLHSGADGVTTLLGIYRNEPDLLDQDRSKVHYGALRLGVDLPSGEIQGGYWTDRGTKGELTLRRVSRRCVATFAAAEALNSST